MLFGSSRNGRLEMTQFSVPTTSGTVSVIRRNAKRNTSGLTAMWEGQRWILNVPTILLWYTEPPSLGLRPKLKNPAILETCFLSIWPFWVSICQPRDRQSKPLSTAPPWHPAKHQKAKKKYFCFLTPFSFGKALIALSALFSSWLEAG